MGINKAMERLVRVVNHSIVTGAALRSRMLPHPNLTAALSLSPLSRSSLNVIRSSLTRSSREYPLATTPHPKEKHAAVLIPLCNVNDKAGILLELRGKLRTHSGEVRCGDYLPGQVAEISHALHPRYATMRCF
jgi:hypothetical protein